MKILVIIVSSLYALVSFSQTNLDSLRTSWESTSNHDTIRLNSLGELIIKGYIFSQPDSAYYLAQQGIAYSISKNLPIYHGKFLSIQGVSFDIRGRGDEALAAYQKSVAMHKSCGNKYGEASVLNNIGAYYYHIDKLELAINSFIASKDLYEELNLASHATEALNNIGAVYNELGSDSLAIAYMTLALEASVKMDNKEGVAQGYVNLGIMHQEKGRYKLSLEMLTKGLKLYKKLNDKLGIFLGYNSLGLLYYSQEKYELALDYYIKSLDVAQEMDNKLDIADAYSNIGNVYSEQNKNVKALEFYQRALKIYRGQEKRSNVAGLYLNIGSVILDFDTLTDDSYSGLLIEDSEFKLADFETKQTREKLVRNLYYESLDIYEIVGVMQGVVKANLLIAKLEMQKGKHALALKHARKAYSLAKKMSNIRLEMLSVEVLYKVLKKINNPSESLAMHEEFILLKDNAYPLVSPR